MGKNWYINNTSGQEFLKYNKEDLDKYLKNLKISLNGKIHNIDEFNNKTPWELLAIMDYFDKLMRESQKGT